MESILPGDASAGPHRGRLSRAIKESLRDLGAQLSQLNHSVEVTRGLLAEECSRMLSNFFLERRGKKRLDPHPMDAEEAILAGPDSTHPDEGAE